MENEENDIPESNIIHINTHVLTKQIYHLLKTLNPQIKSSNLNEHFCKLIQTLITQDEFAEFDLQIKMKNICIELEKCIPNSKTTILFLEQKSKKIVHFVAPSIHETIQFLVNEYNQSDHKNYTSLEYKMRVSNISQDSRWKPYYHYFEKLGLTACWTIPVYRTKQFICSFGIYTSTYKNPISKELHCIHEKKNHFNQLICAYPTDFTSYWIKCIAKTD